MCSLGFENSRLSVFEFRSLGSEKLVLSNCATPLLHESFGMIVSRLPLVSSGKMQKGTNRKVCQPVKGSTMHDFYSLALRACYQKKYIFNQGK